MNDSDRYKSKIYDYDILLGVRDGKILMRISELNIFSTGDDIKEVYETISKKKDEAIRDYKIHGALDEIPLPITSLRSPEPVNTGGYMPFMIKSAFLAGMVALTVFVGLSFMENQLEKVGNKLSYQVDRIKNIRLGRKIENQLLKEGEQELSPEKQEQLIKSIRKIVTNYKPIVNEALLLFKNDLKQ
jgi:hypothetical protein